MSNVASARQAGRYQTRHRFVDPTLRTLTSLSTGVFIITPVTHKRIRVTNFGFTANADTGAVTTVPVIQIEKLTAALNGTAAALFVGSTLNAVIASQQGPVAAVKNLDQAVVDSAGIKGVENYPILVRGDLMQLNLTVQGVGGTQVGYAWIEFCEEPDPDTSNEE